MATVSARTKLCAHRRRFGNAGLLAGLLAIAGCGTGYEEGAGPKFDAGSEAHGEAIVAIARELSAAECGEIQMWGDERCEDLHGELMGELGRCLNAKGCDGVLAASIEGEGQDVAAYLAIVETEARMKAVRERAGRRWGLTPIR